MKFFLRLLEAFLYANAVSNALYMLWMMISIFFYSAPYGYGVALFVAYSLLIILVFHIPLVIGLVKGSKIAYAVQLATIYLLPIGLELDLCFEIYGIPFNLSFLILLSALGFEPCGILFVLAMASLSPL